MLNKIRLVGRMAFITYGILTKLQSTHHILATLFTKVMENGCPPDTWSESIIKLIHKKGDPKDPRNFRMIALTSTIGKTYHLLLAKRTTDFLVKNEIIDQKLQKAFLPGISGCNEHNLVMDEIITLAKKQRKTAHITFFDLEDAFGSVPHNLIFETLRRNNFPQPLQKYFKSLYTNARSKNRFAKNI